MVYLCCEKIKILNGDLGGWAEVMLCFLGDYAKNIWKPTLIYRVITKRMVL